MTDYGVEIEKLRGACWPIKGAYIAGGAVTSVFNGTDIKDADIYFKSEQAFQEAVMGAYEDGWWCVAVSKRSVTFSDNGKIVQFMHFGFFPTADDIFAAFDFTVCMGALDYDSNELVLHRDFLKHNSQRFLRFNGGTRFPLASATRVLKYQQKGYTIGKGDILKIALACRGIRIESWEDLKDQIGGAYGEKVEITAGDKPYSIEAAIEVIAAAGDQLWAPAANDNGPGSAEALLKEIAALNGVPYVAPTFEEWVEYFGAAA